MSKDSILDYSITASENQDIGGTSILGTAKPSNLDDAMRTEMAHIAKGLVTRRVAKDTAYTAVKADHNQMIDFTETATLTTSSAATLTSGWMCFVYASGGSVTINPNGSETVNGEESIQIGEDTLGILRVYDGNFLFSAFGGGAGLPTVTVYDTAGSSTHTFGDKTTKFQVEGCGGGGAGAGTTSLSAGTGDTHFGHGGNSGWYYASDILDRGAIVSASLTVGAGGTSAVTVGPETNGGNTTYSDGTNSFTWDGGFTPPALGAGNVGVQLYQYNQATTPAVADALFGQGRFGTRGVTWSGTGVVGSGYGGSTPYGQGGLSVASSSAGAAGTGNGSGGSGSAKSSGGTTTYLGGAGRPGIIIIREWTE